MSGGSWEYVMANYNDVVGNSGFSEPLTLDTKYYNKYTSNNTSQACNESECISHGLSETAGWYNDYRTMVSETDPWLVRGGRYASNTGAGMFYFYPWNPGAPSVHGSFRLVLAPSI